MCLYYYTSVCTYKGSGLNSLSAWLIEGDSAVPLLNVEVLDVVFARIVPLVLEVLRYRLLNFILQHSLGIVTLLIIGLAVIVDLTTDDVVSNQMGLMVVWVKEGQVRLVVDLEVMDHTGQLV